MSPESHEVQNPRANNKHNKAHRETERRNIKILRISGIVAGALVVLLIAAGLIYQYIYKPNKTMAKVGNEKINATEYQEAVRYQRAGMISNYNYMKQLYQAFGMQMDEATTNSYKTQLSADLKVLIGQQVLSNMVDQRVMDYGAKKEGITVSDEEVQEKMRGMFSYYPNGTPTTAPTDVPFAATPTVSQAELDILRYTPTPIVTETIVPETTAEASTEPTAEGENADDETLDTVTDETVDEAEATIVPTTEPAAEEPTAIPEPTLTPTTYTEEMYQENQNNYFANEQYYSKEFFTKEVYYEALQQKITDKLSVDVPREAEMVWARHILVDTEEEAQTAIDRLNAGEEWGDLVAELSTDDSNNTKGGDLGWFQKEDMTPEFSDAAFAQEVGTISQKPVQTSYGYHVIQVVAHEDAHPLTSDQYDTVVKQKLQEWIDKYSEEIGVTMATGISDDTPSDPEFTE